jgi:hypothetical protein
VNVVEVHSASTTSEDIHFVLENNSRVVHSARRKHKNEKIERDREEVVSPWLWCSWTFDFGPSASFCKANQNKAEKKKKGKEISLESKKMWLANPNRKQKCR